MWRTIMKKYIITLAAILFLTQSFQLFSMKRLESMSFDEIKIQPEPFQQDEQTQTAIISPELFEGSKKENSCKENKFRRSSEAKNKSYPVFPIKVHVPDCSNIMDVLNLKKSNDENKVIIRNYYKNSEFSYPTCTQEYENIKDLHAKIKSIKKFVYKLEKKAIVTVTLHLENFKTFEFNITNNNELEHCDEDIKQAKSNIQEKKVAHKKLANSVQQVMGMFCDLDKQ